MPTKLPSVVVVVPGANHVPEHFHYVADLLQNDGLKVVAVRLPVPGDEAFAKGYEGYLSVIRQAILQEIRLGNNVLLVLHSASGITGSAAMMGLAKKPGSSQPGVFRIFGISAILPPPGVESSLIAGGKNDETIVLPYDEPGPTPTEPAMMRCSPVKALYNDTTGEQKRWAYDLLVPTPPNILSVPPDYAGWQDVPLTFVYCERDLAIAPSVQEETFNGTGVAATVRRLDASHSAFISMPDKLADLIKEALVLDAE